MEELPYELLWKIYQYSPVNSSLSKSNKKYANVYHCYIRKKVMNKLTFNICQSTANKYHESNFYNYINVIDNYIYYISFYFLNKSLNYIHINIYRFDDNAVILYLSIKPKRNIFCIENGVYFIDNHKVVHKLISTFKNITNIQKMNINYVISLVMFLSKN